MKSRQFTSSCYFLLVFVAANAIASGKFIISMSVCLHTKAQATRVRCLLALGTAYVVVLLSMVAELWFGLQKDKVVDKIRTQDKTHTQRRMLL